MNHDNDDNEDDDRVEHIHADDDSEGSGNNVNLDQMYSDFQQETLFMQPISREILLHHSFNDPNVTTQEELITTLNTDLMMESFIASVANSHSDLETFDWVPCSECGQCPCSWLKVRGAIRMFSRNRWVITYVLIIFLKGRGSIVAKFFLYLFDDSNMGFHDIWNAPN